MSSTFTDRTVDGDAQTFMEFMNHAVAGLVEFRELEGQPAPAGGMEVSPYLIAEVERAQARLAELEEYTDELWRLRAKAAHGERLREHFDAKASVLQMRQRITARIAQVEAWTPPTDGHINLKRFALEQLRKSLQLDAAPFDLPEPVAQTGEEFKEEQLRWATEGLQRAQQNLEAANADCSAKNVWLHHLRQSLNPRAELEG